MPKITCCKTTSFLLVGIPSSFQGFFDLLSQRIVYNWPIHYKQGRSPAAPFKTGLWNQRPGWQSLRRSAMSNDGEPEMAKPEVPLAAIVQGEGQCPSVFHFTAWAGKCGSAYTEITVPFLLTWSLFTGHTCPFGSGSTSSGGTLCLLFFL